MDQEVRRAIAHRQLLQFTYHRLRRVAEPHVYGVKDGKQQLLTYQVAGESSSGGLPAWRRVNLSEVSDLRVLDEQFAGPRPPPSGKHANFDTVLAVVSKDPRTTSE